MDPSNDKYYGNRALAYQALGDYEKSLSDFKKALSINPNQVAYPLGISLVKALKKDFQGACSDWKRLTNSGVEQAAALVDQYCN